MPDEPDAPEPRTLSPEHKARLLEGRRRHFAEKRAKRDELAQAQAEIARLQRELQAAKTTSAPSAPAPAQAHVTEIAATQRVECVYRFKPKGGWRVAALGGHGLIASADDPRWEGELMEPPYNGTVSGALEVSLVTRIGDRIVETKDICGGPCHMNTARQFMRDFKARADAGEERPWDVDHFFRDEKARAEKAKREGRLEELAAIREMFLAATRGGADAARARETVTA